MNTPSENPPAFLGLRTAWRGGLGMTLSLAFHGMVFLSAATLAVESARFGIETGETGSGGGGGPVVEWETLAEPLPSPEPEPTVPEQEKQEIFQDEEIAEIPEPEPVSQEPAQKQIQTSTPQSTEQKTAKATIPKPIVKTTPQKSVQKHPSHTQPTHAGKSNSTHTGSGGARSHAKPAYRRNPAPPYPASAKRRGWEGTVILNVRVNEKGRALSVRIKRSSGHTILDKSALNTVKKWRFYPAKVGSVAIASTVNVPVSFRLN